MVYIPIEWVRNEGNSKQVYNILDKLDQDIKTEDSVTTHVALKELRAMGEDIVASKVEAGIVVFGA